MAEMSGMPPAPPPPMPAIMDAMLLKSGMPPAPAPGALLLPAAGAATWSSSSSESESAFGRRDRALASESRKLVLVGSRLRPFSYAETASGNRPSE